jgi:hypothetical protein
VWERKIDQRQKMVSSELKHFAVGMSVDKVDVSNQHFSATSDRVMGMLGGKINGKEFFVMGRFIYSDMPRDISPQAVGLQGTVTYEAPRGLKHLRAHTICVFR